MAQTRVRGFLETSDSCHSMSSNASSAPDGIQSMTSNPVHHSSAAAKFVVTVGPDNSFPLPPSPLVHEKAFTSDSSGPQSRALCYHPPQSSRSLLPQIGLVYEDEHPASSDWLSEQNADDTPTNRTPSPMFPKDSPSSSNRSSTSSSNSSGYLGSSSQVNHSLPPGKQCRSSSGHSSESGLSSIASSRYSYLSGSSSSQSSLDNPEETGGGGVQPSSSVHVSESFHRGLEETEVVYAWLNDLHLTDCYPLFVQAGYDMPTISRMTPEDLTAIGITQPTIRKRLTSEISRLRISDGIPNHRPNTLLEWLQCLGLVDYYKVLAKDGYEDLDRVLDIIWEDLEEIGIRKLGHQKKLMLAIDRLKKLKQSMQRLSSSVDQYTAAATLERPNQAKSTATSCCLATTTTATVPPPRLLRRSFSGENVAVLPRVSRLASHPPHVTSPPQPEMVIIQVNNASRSWTGNAVVDDETSDNAAVITYESFYGNPLLDFHCLRKEADGGGDTTPTNEKAASEEEELDRVKGGSPGGVTAAGIRFRHPPPPLLAPKPKLTCRARRASGGSASLHSERTTFVACDDPFTLTSGSGSGPRAQTDARRAVASSSDRELFARPTSAASLSSAQSARAHGMASSAKSAVPPPPPPKRTNSVVRGESPSSAVDSEHAIAEETTPYQPPSSPRHVKIAGRRGEASGFASTESSVYVDSNVKSQHPEIASQKDEVSALSPTRQKVFSTSITGSLSRENSVPPSGSGSPDCNTLPFANENIGTIRQKPAGRFPALTKVLNEAKPLGALGRDSAAREFRDTSEKTVKPAPVGRKPARPVPKQKPKFSGSKESKNPKTSVAGSGATDKADDVFNDIDNLFQGLSQELDQMLTFQG